MITRLRLLVIILVMLGGFNSINAQNASFIPDNLEPITSENIDRLTQVAMLGTGTIESIAWSPDNETIAAVGSAGIRIFDTNDLSAEPRWLTGHIGKVNDAAFTSDGTRLASVGDDGTVRWWDVATGQMLSSFCPFLIEGGCEARQIMGVALSPDDSLLALGTPEINVILNSQTNGIASSFSGDGARVRFSPDGTLLATAGFNDGTITILQMEESAIGSQFEIAVPFAIWDFAFTPDSRFIALAAFSDEAIELFDLTTRQTVGQYAGEFTVTVHPDGSQLATTDFQFEDEQRIDMVNIWNLESGERLQQLPTSGISRLRYSPDGTKLAAGYIDGGLTVWDTDNYTTLGYVEGRGAAVRDLALIDNILVSLDGFDYDVNTLSDGTGPTLGNTIRTWDMNTGQELHSWQGTEIDPALTILDGVLRHIPNTDQFVLKNPSLPNNLYVWDIFTGQVTIINAEDYAGEVSNVSSSDNPIALPIPVLRTMFNEDHTLLISAGFDGTIRFWGVPING